ncbi:hypothetical protein EHS25_000944 [Saitozyma podzolica]|uniref:Uncharacterized protein n=1 Tax=Saitozyma podzolica TaxID=1890683 RepID=A0A427YXQ0_9TREE|nr:hypothetical protein EHS25_000944 [Saitozyma podzolica]
MRLAEKPRNFGVPLASLEYAPAQSLAGPPTDGPPTDPVPNNEPFMLASMESREDDPLAFLSLDIPMLAVYDWGFSDQDFNMFEPHHTTGSGNGDGSRRNSPLTDFTVGFGWCDVDPSVLSGLGSGGDEKKGLLDPRTGVSLTDSLHGRPQEIPDGQPDASPWPHVYKPKDRDAGVSLTSLSSPFAAAALVLADDHIPETAWGTMRALVEHSYCGIWPTVEIGNLPSVQALTTPADLYNRHFHSLLLSYRDHYHGMAPQQINFLNIWLMYFVGRRTIQLVLLVCSAVNLLAVGVTSIYGDRERIAARWMQAGFQM